MTTTTITLTVATVEEKAVPHRTISCATCSPSTNASPKSTWRMVGFLMVELLSIVLMAGVCWWFVTEVEL
jgi:hypothetical protein